MHIYYYPAFKSKHELEHHFRRAIWYFPESFVSKISFFSEGSIDLEDITFPDFVNSTLKKTATDLINRKVVELRPKVDFPDLHKENSKTVLLVWDKRAETSTEVRNLVKSGVKTFNISDEYRMEGSLYIEVFKNEYFRDYQGQLKHYENFSELRKKYDQLNNAVIFCSGPSLKDYKKFEYKNCLRIICNSLIAHEELMDYVRPQILVFGDPIFHFGYSSYAEKFLNDLNRSLTKYPELMVFIPCKYYPLVISHFPHWTTRIIGVPYTNRDYNYDLSVDFELQSTDNILTFLMIPIATTISKNIFIIGADGRPKEENKYFWKHNKEAQYNKELEEIKLAHTSFFKLSYDDYYNNHIKRLTGIIKEGEKRGYAFFNLTDSYIPILHKNFIKYQRNSYLNSQEELPYSESYLISYNPMLVNEFGHYLNYDLNVLRNGNQDQQRLILANHQYHEKQSSGDVKTVPLLPYKQIDNLKNFSLQKTVLLKFLRSLPSNSNIIFFAYTGSIFDAYLFFELSNEFPSIQFKLNLFSVHNDYKRNSEDPYKIKLYKQLGKISKNNLKYYIDSKILLNTVFEDSNFGFWPMIHASNIIGNQERSKTSATKKILIPSTLQFAKGAELILSLFNAVKDSNITDLQFTIRGKIVGNATEATMLAKIKKTISKFDFVNIIEGNFTDEEFCNLFSSSDIVLIPYTEKEFKTRTSGTLVDAVAWNKPIITSSRTWLGGEVQNHNLGKTYYHNDPHEILAIINSINNEARDYAVAYLNYSSKNVYDLLCSNKFQDIKFDKTEIFYTLECYFLELCSTAFTKRITSILFRLGRRLKSFQLFKLR